MGPRDPSRSIVLVVGVVVLLVAAATGAVLILGAPGIHEYPADSPEGTIQRYLRALDDDDPATAYALFSARVRQTMSESSFVDLWTAYGGQYRYGQPSAQRRVQVDRAELKDDVAVVSLTIEEWSGSGLEQTRWSWGTRIRLVREAGGWRIDEAIIGLEPGPPPVMPAPAP